MSTEPRISRTRRRGRRIAVLSVIVAVVFTPYVVSRARGPGRRVVLVAPAVLAAPAARDGGLRIVSYNIAHGRGPVGGNLSVPASEKPARIRQIAEMLAAQDADVVVLSEVDFDSTWSGNQNQAAAIALQAGYPYRAEQRNLDFRFVYGSWKFGNAILSRFPIVDAEVVDLPPYLAAESWLAGHKRGLVCTLELEPGRLVRVLAVHLDFRPERVRVASARMIEALAGSSDIPLIAAGDFNSTPPGLPESHRTSAGENAMEVLLHSAFFHTRIREPADIAAMTFPSGEPERAIDWILIPDDWGFSEYEVLDTQLSDHRPVAAVIRAPDWH